MLVPVLLGPQGDALVARIEAVRFPKWVQVKENDKAFMANYWPALAKANGERNRLILQLLKDDPNYPKTVSYMKRRWKSLETGNLRDGREYAKRILADVDRVLAQKPPQTIVQLGETMKMEVRQEYGLDDLKTSEAKLDAFIAKHPDDQAGETAIRGWIARLAPSDQWRGYAKYLKVYPDGPYAKAAAGVLRGHDGVGKPFELTFTDPITG